MANKLIAFHGGGGNGGPGGYGDGKTAPSAPWYTTIRPDQLSQSDWGTLSSYINGQVQTGDNVIVTGFSLGCLAAQKCLANWNSSVWKGTLRGVIIDDPAADFSLTFPTEAASNVKRALYCAQWSGAAAPANDWTVETITGGGGAGAIANLAGRMGVSPIINPCANYHSPAQCCNPQGGSELAQNSAWWTGGGVVTPPVDPPPPAGDQTTYQAENYMPVINPMPSGGRASGDSPGYSGSGYVGYWWQIGEIVRFVNVTGGASSGNRTLRFRYRTAEASGATRRLRVNGVDRGVVTFPKNANAWTEATFSDVVVANIPMNVGEVNTVELVIEAQGGVDLDYMLVDATGGTTPPPPTTGGATAPRVIAGENIWPADTLFYADISASPLLAGGAAKLAGHASDPTFKPEWGVAGYTDQVTCDFGSGQYNGRPFGFPLTIVEATQPLTQMSDVTYNSESDVNTGEFWPVPTNALLEHVTADSHVTVLQKGTHRLYEAWDAIPNVGANTWHTGANATWDLTSYGMRPDTWTSADGSGMPILPLSVSDDEVVDVGEINHALRMCMSYLQSGYVWPASHNMDPAQSRSPRLSAGHWLRLKASVDLSARGLGPQATIIANALKKHGAIIIDIGPIMKINGLYGPRWNNNDLNTIRGLHLADFEVIDPTPLRVSTSDRTLWFKINQNVGTTPPPAGSTIPWSDRPTALTIKAEDPAYRSAAASALVAECQGGWDGIYLTDSLVDVRHGIGVNTAYDTSAEVQALTTTLLTQIGTALRNAGFLAVAETPGIAAFSTLNDTLEALATGVADPEFLRNAAGTYAGQTTAVQQANNVVHSGADPQNAYSHFNVEGGIYVSEAAAIHALATYLCFNDGTSVLGLAADTGFNDPPPYIEDFTYDYGAQTVARANPFSGVYIRRFANGVAVTNLSTTQQTVTLGGTYYPKNSTTGQTTVVVPGSSGAVLRSTPGTGTPPPNPVGSTGTMQAELGVLANPAATFPFAVAASSPGFNGTGYIGGWWQSGENVTLTINVTVATTYDLTFRYRCAEPDGGAQRTLSVNGGAGITLDFPTNTPAWTNNAWATIARTQVALNAGNNTIKLTCPSSSGDGLDWDEMSWAPSGGGTTPPPTGSGTGKWEFASNEFKDPEGRRVAMLGANGPMQQFPAIDTPFIMNMPVTQPPGPRATFTGRSAQVQQWGWNMIRVIINANQSGALGYAQALVDEYSAKKIVTIFCHLPHQDSGYDPPTNLSGVETQAALNFYRQLLASRPDNPYIWCDPGGEVIRSNDGTYWAAFYTAFYNQLRAMPGGAFTPMTCTCKGFGQDLAGTRPLWSAFASGKTRVILDWHAYFATMNAATAQTELNAVRSANIPFIIMEHGYLATPASGPPAGYNPGACCGSTYAAQRPGCLQIIDTWVPSTHVNALWWTGCGDDNQQSGHSLRYNPALNGTYLDFNMAFSEYGQKMWNVGQTSRFY